MDKHEKKALADIEKYGCHILNVFENEEFSCFSYSIGIEQTTGQPELIVTGLNQEVAQSIINDYCAQVRAGKEFKPDEYYDDFLEGFQVTFKKMRKNHYKEYLGWGRWLYKGNDFKTLQLIYPTKSGIWPWDEDAPEGFDWYIPKLY